MAQLLIQLELGGTTAACGLCGRRITAPAGPRLVRAEDRAVVCPGCGRQHAPALVALMDLAQVAQKVGRIGRHTLVPPLSALLELARAAENYTYSTGASRKRAA